MYHNVLPCARKLQRWPIFRHASYYTILSTTDSTQTHGLFPPTFPYGNLKYVIFSFLPSST